jgi:Rieske Fe-S protein
MPSKPASTQWAESARPVRWALVPLRAFLGFTFCFAGLQKLANPGFLDAASPVSIQSQLAAAGLGRLAGGTAKTIGVSSLPPRAARGAAATAVGSQGHVPSGKAIGPARDVPVGQAATFTDPASGDPSIVIQPQAGNFVAFDAVCPHAGCTVSYDPTAKLIVCPCHGSEFSASTGAVELGPAATGLSRITIAEGRDGQLYVS